MKRLAIATLLLCGSASPARADVLRPRDAATLIPQGNWSLGLFDPLRIGVARGVEVSTHPIVDLLLTPNVVTRVAFRETGPVRVTGEYGLSVPTFGMRLTQGYLFPSWDTSDSKIGWFVVPSVGVAVSVVDAAERSVFTARLDSAIGVPLSGNDAKPLDTYAPIELAFAPTLTGSRTHLGLGYDRALTPWLRVRGGVDGWLTGPTEPAKSPLYLAAWIGADARLSQRFRVGLGVIMYDHDQRRKDVVRGDDGRWRRVPVRSQDFYPTFDVIYER